MEDQNTQTEQQAAQSGGQAAEGLAGNGQVDGQNQANLSDLGHTGPKDGDEALTTSEQHREMAQRQNRSQQQGNSEQMNSGREDRDT